MRLDYSVRAVRDRRLRGRSDAGSPAPFVVGVPRSGNTLLRLMLDAHPQLAIPPETKFMHPFIQRSGRLRFNPQIAVQAIVEGSRGRWANFGLEQGELLEGFRALDRFNAADALRSFYELYAARHGKPRWGDKTPGYLIRMKEIQSVLPEARFIHMIRDGRDAALSQNSRRRKQGLEPKSMRQLARRWRTRIIDARADARELNGYLEVHFEHLVADPEIALHNVCSLIELEYRPEMLAYHKRAEERLQEMSAPVRSRNGRLMRAEGERVAAHAMLNRPPSQERVGVWRQQMSDHEKLEFEDEAGDLLASLGYDTIGEPEARTPVSPQAPSRS